MKFLGIAFAKLYAIVLKGIFGKMGSREAKPPGPHFFPTLTIIFGIVVPAWLHYCDSVYIASSPVPVLVNRILRKSQGACSAREAVI